MLLISVFSYFSSALISLSSSSTVSYILSLVEINSIQSNDVFSKSSLESCAFFLFYLALSLFSYFFYSYSFFFCSLSLASLSDFLIKASTLSKSEYEMYCLSQYFQHPTKFSSLDAWIMSKRSFVNLKYTIINDYTFEINKT